MPDITDRISIKDMQCENYNSLNYNGCSEYFVGCSEYTVGDLINFLEKFPRNLRFIDFDICRDTNIKYDSRNDSIVCNFRIEKITLMKKEY